MIYKNSLADCPSSHSTVQQIIIFSFLNVRRNFGFMKTSLTLLVFFYVIVIDDVAQFREVL